MKGVITIINCNEPLFLLSTSFSCWRDRSSAATQTWRNVDESARKYSNDDRDNVVALRSSLAHSHFEGIVQVYVFESQKSMAIKPSNLRYEPRELSSLSISEINGLLSFSSEEAKGGTTDEDELRRLVAAEIATEDPEEIAALVAKANEPKDLPSSSSRDGDADANNKAASLHGSNQLRQGAERIPK